MDHSPFGPEQLCPEGNLWLSLGRTLLTKFYSVHPPVLLSAC